jgi:hypothetical protein
MFCLGPGNDSFKGVRCNLRPASAGDNGIMTSRVRASTMARSNGLFSADVKRELSTYSLRYTYR